MQSLIENSKHAVYIMPYNKQLLSNGYAIVKMVVLMHDCF